MSTPLDGRPLEGLRGAWRHRLTGWFAAAPLTFDSIVEGWAGPPRNSPLWARRRPLLPTCCSGRICAQFQETLTGAAACLLLAPLVFPIGTDAIPVLKPAPSRPQTLVTADPCAFLAGLIRIAPRRLEGSIGERTGSSSPRWGL